MLGPGSGTFLEVASMVASWWILAFLHCVLQCVYFINGISMQTLRLINDLRTS